MLGCMCGGGVEARRLCMRVYEVCSGQDNFRY